MRRYSAFDTSPRYLDTDSRYAPSQNNGDETKCMLLPAESSSQDHAQRSWYVECSYNKPSDPNASERAPHDVLGNMVHKYDPHQPSQQHAAPAFPSYLHTTTPYVTKLEHHKSLSESITDTTCSSKQYHRNVRHLREPWTPGVWRNMPWIGFGALLLVLLLTAAFAVIVFLSSGKPYSHFTPAASPQICLAIIDTLSTLLTFYALSSGLTIYFWRTLLRGTTIAQIHDTHNASHLLSTLPLLLRGHFSKPAFATLLTTISLARGPLFQRALDLAPSSPTYRTSLPFAITGIIISLLPVPSILSLYSGFSTLGRKVSLNPLEVARAFGAPMFEGLDGNATAGDVEMQKGSLRVKYGAVEAYGGEKVLRVEECAGKSVRGVREGEIFG